MKRPKVESDFDRVENLNSSAFLKLLWKHVLFLKGKGQKILWKIPNLTLLRWVWIFKKYSYFYEKPRLETALIKRGFYLNKKPLPQTKPLLRLQMKVPNANKHTAHSKEAIQGCTKHFSFKRRHEAQKNMLRKIWWNITTKSTILLNLPPRRFATEYSCPS